MALAKELARKAIQSRDKLVTSHPSVAEAKDVKFHVIEEREAPAGRTLVLEGLVFHSALAVNEVRQERRDDAIVVEVGLAPATGNSSGRFSIELRLVPDVHRVLFGRDLALVWSDVR